MKTEYKIIDNFLPKDTFNKLASIALGPEIPYYFNKEINWPHDEKDEVDLTCYFTHALFNMENDYIYSNYFHHFGTIFYDALEMKSLIRMKMNLYCRTSEVIHHKPHVDLPFEHKGCVFSFNTCNGGTVLEDGTFIESVANRALLFNPNKPHHSTSCTNAKARVNINLNYF